MQKENPNLLQKAVKWLGWELAAGGTNLAQPQSAEEAAEYSDRNAAVKKTEEGLSNVLEVQKAVIPGVEPIALAHQGDMVGAAKAGVEGIVAGVVGGALLTKIVGKLIKLFRKAKGPGAAYNRSEHYGKTPTKADRKALGAGADEVVDHDPPLVQRYYDGDPAAGEKPGWQLTPEERRSSANDRSRMKRQPKKE